MFKFSAIYAESAEITKLSIYFLKMCFWKTHKQLENKKIRPILWSIQEEEETIPYYRWAMQAIKDEDD